MHGRASALSLYSLFSFRSIGSLASFFSVLSIGSAGSILSIGASGGILRFGSRPAGRQGPARPVPRWGQEPAPSGGIMGSTAPGALPEQPAPGGGAGRPPPVAGPLCPGRRWRSRALRPARRPRRRSQDSPLLTGLEGFRRLLSRNGLKDGGAIGGGGDLRFRRLDHAAADTYRWPDRVSRDLFAGAVDGQVWALAWSGRQESAPVDPLAILVPGRLLRRPALMHLVPGLPTTPL